MRVPNSHSSHIIYAWAIAFILFPAGAHLNLLSFSGHVISLIRVLFLVCPTLNLVVIIMVAASLIGAKVVFGGTIPDITLHCCMIKGAFWLGLTAVTFQTLLLFELVWMIIAFKEIVRFLTTVPFGAITGIWAHLRLECDLSFLVTKGPSTITFIVEIVALIILWGSNTNPLFLVVCRCLLTGLPIGAGLTLVFH